MPNQAAGPVMQDGPLAGLPVPQDQNPFLQGNNDAVAEEVKKKQQRFKITSEDLTDGPMGLNQLYIQSVIKGGKQNELKLRGKGHEASDLNKIIQLYKKWHMNFAPKYQFSYFTDRMTKMSSDKTVKSHMSKLRSVYQGEDDHMVEFAGEQVSLKDFHFNGVPSNSKDKENTQNGVKATDKKEGIPYFSYNEASKGEKATEEVGKEGAQFRMLDGPDDNPMQMMINTNQPGKSSDFQSLTKQGEALRNNPGLSEEQMRRMEENRRKAMERKRKSMQVMQESEAQAANTDVQDEGPSKRQKTDKKEEDDIAKNVCKVMDAAGQSADEEDEIMDENDLADLMD